MAKDNTPKPTEIILVEDDRDLRGLLQLLFNGTHGFYCRAAYANGESLLAELPKFFPDLILMDIDLGEGINGVETVRRIRAMRPTQNVVMLTVHEDEESVFAALCAGAVGYLVKGLEPVKLLDAARSAAEGGAPMSPIIARRVIRTFHAGPDNPLTAREKEVLGLLCEGESYREIGGKLYISGNTVRSHIKHIYEKLHVHSRAEVVVKAIREKLI